MDILSLSFKELESEIKSLGIKSFRAKQIYKWLHEKGVDTFDEMKNLSKDLRDKLKENFKITKIKIYDEKVSKDGTKKFLLELEDKNIIEVVLMEYKHGNTICISSQIGCKMGCDFCASTKNGLVRNLKVSEMLKQVYLINKIEKISNIVIMGIGEPFDNYENVIKFIEMINDDKGLNIGMRKITVSTVGLVDKMISFADLNIQANLAVSLHASNDEIRKKIMKVSNKYSIYDIIDASNYYIDKTNRRITFEYILIKDVNDKKEHAEELSKLLKYMNCFVNIIPMNEIEKSEYKRSKNAKEFSNILTKNKIQNTIRRELGQDIDGACGQLRKKHLESE